MSSAVSLPNHTFTGQAQSSKRLTSIVHILSPETDNCPSWISGRERMTVENISWSISTKECCRPRRGLNLRPPGLQSDGASNWATKAGTVSVKVSSKQREISGALHALSSQTVKIQISWLFQNPTDLDLHCLSLNKWFSIKNPDQVIWLAGN